MISEWSTDSDVNGIIGIICIGKVREFGLVQRVVCEIIKLTLYCSYKYTQQGSGDQCLSTIDSMLPPPLPSSLMIISEFSNALLVALVHILEVDLLLLLDHTFGIVFPHIRQLDVSLDTIYRKLKMYLIVLGTSAQWLVLLSAVYKFFYSLAHVSLEGLYYLYIAAVSVL